MTSISTHADLMRRAYRATHGLVYMVWDGRRWLQPVEADGWGSDLAALASTLCNLSGCLAAIRPPPPSVADAGGEVGPTFAGEGHGGIEDPREPCPASLRLAGIYFCNADTN
jgi:hypothetical protein